MDEDQNDISSAILTAALSHPPLYEIPSDLIDKWQALPLDHEFVPALPRVAWDKLYMTIEILNLLVSTSAHLVMSAAQGNREDSERTMTKFATQTSLVQNSLKQFQQMMMQAAVDGKEGGKLDG